MMEDHLLGLTWDAERADIDLSRHAGGGMDGQAILVLAMADQKAILTGKFNIPPHATGNQPGAARADVIHVLASLSQVTPKALVKAAPVLAPLGKLDAPMTLDGDADLGPDLLPSHMRLTARAGAGKVNVAGGTIPMRHAEFVVAGTLEQVTLERATMEIQPTPGGPVSTLAGTGTLAHRDGHVAASMHLTVDHLSFGDLGTFWPAGVAHNARDWLLHNVVSGTAHDGKADLVLAASDQLDDIALNSVSATLEGDEIAVVWLPTVPRIEHARTHLSITDPDRIDIDVRSGRQTVKASDPIDVRNGRVTIAGLSTPHQVATIRCDTAGSLPSAIALLKEPRLGLLDRHPMDLRAPSGDVHATIQAVVPLERYVTMDDVTIRGTGTLNKVHLTGIVVGRDLDDGAVGLDVDTAHLSIRGTASVANIPATIEALMDFRPGPPTQVLRKYSASGRPTARALADAGLSTGDVLTGEIGINLVFSEYRERRCRPDRGRRSTPTQIAVSPLGWRKPSGVAAKATGRLTLVEGQGDRPRSGVGGRPRAGGARRR